MPERTHSHRQRSQPASPKSDATVSVSNSRIPISFSAPNGMHDELKAWARRRGTSVSALIVESLYQALQTQISRSKWENLDDDEDDGFSPMRFFTASDDKQGHSAQIRLYVPKHFAGVIKRVVDSGQIPQYRSNADFYRDALIHRAQIVANWIDNGSLREAIDLMTMMSEEAAISQERKEMQNLLYAMEENIEALLTSGHLDYLAKYIADKWDRVDGLPELHRDAYMAVLRKAKERLELARKGH